MSKGNTTARGLGHRHRTVRLIVLERDGYVCRWCGAPATEADHYPVSRHRGGPSTVENMVAACRRCNASRGATEGNALRARARTAPHPFFAPAAHDPTACVFLSPDPTTTTFVVTPKASTT